MHIKFCRNERKRSPYSTNCNVAPLCCLFCCFQALSTKMDRPSPLNSMIFECQTVGLSFVGTGNKTCSCRATLQFQEAHKGAFLSLSSVWGFVTFCDPRTSLLGEEMNPNHAHIWHEGRDHYHAYHANDAWIKAKDCHMTRQGRLWMLRPLSLVLQDAFATVSQTIHRYPRHYCWLCQYPFVRAKFVLRGSLGYLQDNRDGSWWWKKQAWV